MNAHERVRRVPAVDELERDGERMVLLPGRAVRVTGLGPTILDLTEDWVTLATLAERLVEAYGEPDTEPLPLVVEHAEALVGEGLLETATVRPPAPRASAP